jgi:CoA:oxalate CoA-transferase
MTDAGLLADVRVLDFTTMMAGPYCTRQLADLGAEVIKIEAPGGEQNRKAPPLRDGESAVYAHLNCGKHSLVVDLKSAEGKSLVKQLAARCDVIVENGRPGMMARLGLGYEDMQAVRADIIYCAISGFGQTGPSSHNPAYAPVVQAASGYEMAFMHQQPEMTRPGFMGVFHADVMAAVHAFGAINAALFSRERTGRGRFIDVSLMESIIWLLVYELQGAQFPLKSPRGYYRPVKAQDGFVVVAPGGQPAFEALATAVGHPEWIEDPRFLTHGDRYRNYAELMAAVEEWTRCRAAIECETVMRARGVPCARYREVGELFDDPQLKHRGALRRVTDKVGQVIVPNPPMSFSMATTGAADWVAPYGSSAPKILGDVLGLGREVVDDLYRRKVLYGSAS